MAVHNSKLELEGLRGILNLALTPMTGEQSVHDAIFISIDLGTTGPDHTPSDIGIAILDSRRLADFTRGYERHHHPLLPTHHYFFVRRRRPNRRVDKGSHFGEVHRILVSSRVDLRDALARILDHHCRHSIFERPYCGTQTFHPGVANATSDYSTGRQSQTNNQTPCRPIILVGHNVEGDLRCLQKVDFDLTSVAPIVAVLDTQLIARVLYKIHVFRLSNLCWYLNIRVGHFHKSGNDAAYTLLALIRMAAEISDHVSIETVQEVISSALQERRRIVQREPKSIAQDWADNLDGLDPTTE